MALASVITIENLLFVLGTTTASGHLLPRFHWLPHLVGTRCSGWVSLGRWNAPWRIETSMGPLVAPALVLAIIARTPWYCRVCVMWHHGAACVCVCVCVIWHHGCVMWHCGAAVWCVMWPFWTAGDMSSRRTKPEIRTKCLQFSPTGTVNFITLQILRGNLLYVLHVCSRPFSPCV